MSGGNLPGKVQQFLYDLLVRQHPVQVAVHSLLHNLAELLRLHNVCPSVNLYLLRDEPLQHFHSKVLLLHPRDFLKEFRVEQRELPFYIREQVEDALAPDALLQQLVDSLVHFQQRELLPRSTVHQAHDQHPNRLKERRLYPLLLRHKGRAQRQRLMEQQSLFQKAIPRFFPFHLQNEVHRAADSL